jgi:hypothetical protein
VLEDRRESFRPCPLYYWSPFGGYSLIPSLGMKILILIYLAIEIYGMFDEEIYNPIHEKEESKNIWPKSKQRRGEKYDF